MHKALVVVCGLLLSLVVPVVLMIVVNANQPSVEIYQIDNQYFVIQATGFVLAGFAMSIGPAILAFFWPQARTALISGVFVLGILSVVFIKSSEPAYLLDSVLEFVPLFAISVLGSFLLSYTLERYIKVR